MNRTAVYTLDHYGQTHIREAAYAEGYAAGLEQGRADAAAMWPVIAEQSRMEGWTAGRNQFAVRLRGLAREDPLARALLLELLR